MNQENLDALIFPDCPLSADLDYSKEKWFEIIQYTLGRFETFLGVPIEHEDLENSNIGHGFCIDIGSPAPACGAFHVTWKGIYGAGWLENAETNLASFYISATLFLYSNTKKLVTNSRESLLEYEYVRLDDNSCIWRPFIENAWMTDEFEEYEPFDDPDKRFV
tara:strand:- start:412 stop:900 length:489 start_codon:yes stop_codon:yes gene_type:complete